MRRPFRARSAVSASLVGGATFLVVELALLPLANRVPPDWILRLIASLMAGPVTLSWPAGQIGGLILTALAVHAALSLVYGALLCHVADELAPAASVAACSLMGFAIYLVNFYLFTFIWPWFATGRGVATIVAHVLFGGATALAYKGFGGIGVARVQRASP